MFKDRQLLREVVVAPEGLRGAADTALGNTISLFDEYQQDAVALINNGALAAKRSVKQEVAQLERMGEKVPIKLKVNLRIVSPIQLSN